MLLLKIVMCGNITIFSSLLGSFLNHLFLLCKTIFDIVNLSRNKNTCYKEIYLYFECFDGI